MCSVSRPLLLTVSGRLSPICHPACVNTARSITNGALPVLRTGSVAAAVSVTGVLPRSTLPLQLSVGLYMLTVPVYTPDSTFRPSSSLNAVPVSRSVWLP